jgi:hypothetical protein
VVAIFVSQVFDDAWRERRWLESVANCDALAQQ